MFVIKWSHCRSVGGIIAAFPRLHVYAILCFHLMTPSALREGDIYA